MHCPAPAQREPALKLAASLLEAFGMLWIIVEDVESCRFLLLVIHLACIEVRMILDKSDYTEVRCSGIRYLFFLLLRNHL